MEIVKQERKGVLVDRKQKRKGDLLNRVVNGFRLYPVSPLTIGVGMPYAPVDWPCPGDIWSWRVGKRIIASGGYFLDRHLYLPDRLQGKKPRGRGFVSKVSLEHYLRTTFPNTDVKAFFDLFSWKIPCESPSEIEEPSWPESQHAASGCKAGNNLCSSLTEPGKPPAINFCDICCSEPDFCRDCCCILCSKTINPANESYEFVRCESTVEIGTNCGHLAHLECGLKCNMAGTVGKPVCLDVEYYCRRCDTRTDLIPHLKKFLQICDSISSHDDIEKILELGARVLHGSRRSNAKRLLNIFELAMGKQHDSRLEIVPVLNDVCDVDDSSTGKQGVMCHNGVINEEHVDVELRQGSPKKVSKFFDPVVESFKLEYYVDQTLQTLKKSQELEFNIAKKKLYDQKNCIQNLYQQLDKEKSEIKRHLDYVTDPDALLQLTESKVDQIKKELLKLEDMKAVSKGFAKTSKEILKQHFGLEI